MRTARFKLNMMLLAFFELHGRSLRRPSDFASRAISLALSTALYFADEVSAKNHNEELGSK